MADGSQSATFDFPRLEDLPDVAGRAVLVRAALDLPLGCQRGPIAGQRATLLAETLQWLLDRGARVTVFGDVGSSEGGADAASFAAVREDLEALAPGVSLFDASEGSTGSIEDPLVLDALVRAHDAYVNDSFQSSYLPLPSLVRPPQLLPSAVGRNLQRDLELLEPLVRAPERPFVAILGGDRTYLRLHGLRGLVLRADKVLVGGAMALPFLQAIGKQPQRGEHPEFLEECQSVNGLGQRVRHDVVLPLDLVWARPDGTLEVSGATVPGEGDVVDIGPDARRNFGEIIEGARTVFWAGALGRVEDARCTEGTRALGTSVARMDGTVVVGGDALGGLLCAERLRGDAFGILSATDPALELLKSGDLPALAAMRRRG